MVFALVFSIRSSFSNSSRAVAMATNFVAKLPTPCTYRSVIPKRNRYLNERINSVNDAYILCKNFVKFGLVVFELKWGRKWKLCCDSAEISRFSFIWHTWVRKRIGMSQLWFQLVNRQSFLYILWKFGEIWGSDPCVLGKRRCTAKVDNCWHA